MIFRLNCFLVVVVIFETLIGSYFSFDGVAKTASTYNAHEGVEHILRHFDAEKLLTDPACDDDQDKYQRDHFTQGITTSFVLQECL